ncbi:MAG: cytochrome d ubiquinol oxidase subunit II [Armatimonadota bacterium]|nr:cytochrome d ubiquinol oxidase subunit II [Armatimonadota bacterium]MDR7452108.1 cytochrome d ubiquinol oxidase subunit II [Armatimonadota bacterium]MDR7467832.1 cytochrome d ubiquinol oxidase subunit II [Armatimonadota bacterium]MDR7494720.1 cytochrome d ubiquinol oxidase subunit II [Armatimonadota bacterium]MDR7499545.1 cytochrome d ubiquinol oxidase subunit II [Armatimonadota bacterium]
MDLNTLWFVLIGVLYTGFFLLEGFDYGVGMLLPFLGRTDLQRRAIINTIGPFWDGNEVWLITAGGATFAAFPHWYATLFSGFYLPLFVVLLALIVRGVAFEFRSKRRDPRWRAVWDWCLFAGSLLPALVFGVAFANMVRGVPIDDRMTYVGGVLTLLNPYALLGGLALLAVFTLYGAIFLSLRTTGELQDRARATARRLWAPTVFIALAFTVATYGATDILARLGVSPGPVPVGAAAALLFTGALVSRRRDGWAFVTTALAILLTSTTFFMILYPRVMVSSLNPAWSLTIYSAASSAYTLKVMTIVALIFTPIVLLYQGWTYWVFRRRVEAKAETLTY